MSVLLEFLMSTMDKGEILSKYVARSLDIVLIISLHLWEPSWNENGKR